MARRTVDRTGRRIRLAGLFLAVGHARRRARGGGGGHVHRGRGAHHVEALRRVPSARLVRPDVAARLRDGEALRGRDQVPRAGAPHAALARRQERRRADLQERRLAERRADRDDRALGGCRRAPRPGRPAARARLSQGRVVAARTGAAASARSGRPVFALRRPAQRPGPVVGSGGPGRGDRRAPLDSGLRVQAVLPGRHEGGPPWPRQLPNGRQRAKRRDRPLRGGQALRGLPAGRRHAAPGGRRRS